MKLFEKLGLGLFSLLTITSAFTAFLVPASNVSAQAARETAYFSGNTIKFRDVIYEFVGTNTANGGATEGWGYYIRQGSAFSCGNQVIVDNPAANETVALRNTHSEPLDIDNSIAAIGDNCLTDDINTQPWILNVTTEAICSEAGGTWSGPTCTFNDTPSQQRAASTTPPTGVGIPADQDPADEAAQGDELADTCESRTPGWGWLLCGGIDLIDGSINWVDNQIQRLLEVNEDRYTNDNLREVWVTFRNIAYIILIPIMLVMVIGTAIGVEAFSAYTVRKALPRMVAAIIFITLSWYICTFLIGFFNTMGSGVNGLITAPFRQSFVTDPSAPGYDPACADGSLNLTCLFGAEDEVDTAGAGILRGIVSGVAQIGIVIGLVVFLVFFGSTLLIAAVTAFIVLFAREMFIIALILMAPLAILAWIFPGNDKLWKAWWGLFSKLLMMFPLIMGIIAVGRVFAWVINESDGGSLEGSVLLPIMKLGAYLLPYAFIPFTFKFAGGVFANLAGVVNDRNKGLFDRAKKGRAEKAQRWGNRRMFRNDTGVRGKLNTAGAAAFGARKAGVNPMKWKGRMGEHLSTLGLNRADEMMEDKEYNRWKGNDNLNLWAAQSSDERSLRKNLEASGDYERDSNGRLTADGKSNMEKDVASVEKMRRIYGNEAMRQATYLSAMAGGTALDVGVDMADGSKKVHSSAELAAAISGGDRAIQASLVAKGRSAANSAGRVDQGGISFGDGLGEIAKFRSGVVDVVEDKVQRLNQATGKMEEATVETRVTRNVASDGTVSYTNAQNQAVDARRVKTRAANQSESGARTYTSEESLGTTRRRVYERQGAFSLIHPQQKDSVVDHIVPIITEEIQTSMNAISNPPKDSSGRAIQSADELRVDFVAKMASAKALQDSLGSTSPNKARKVQAQLTSQKLKISEMPESVKQMLSMAVQPRRAADGSTHSPTEITYSEAMEAIESNSEFQQFRKEFKSQFDQHATASPEEQARWRAAQEQAAEGDK